MRIAKALKSNFLRKLTPSSSDEIKNNCRAIILMDGNELKKYDQISLIDY